MVRLSAARAVLPKGGPRRVCVRGEWLRLDNDITGVAGTIREDARRRLAYPDAPIVATI